MSEQTDDFMRSWTTDVHGNRVRRGLTLEETIWYEDYKLRQVLAEKDHKPPDHAEDKKFLQLYDKHEAARLLALNAEYELRQKPSIN